MNSSPRQRNRPTPRSKPLPKRRRQQSNAGLVLLCGLLYIAVGLIVTALPTTLWVWPAALGGSWLQVLELTIPSSRLRLSKVSPSLLIQAMRLLGVGTLTLALAVALNHLGTDQLDNVRVFGVLWQVLALSLLALLLALLCRLTTAGFGERLGQRLEPRQVMVILGTLALVGLAIVGIFGTFAV